MPDAEKLAAVRDALPALGAGIYLNTGLAGPLPTETAAAMDELAGWQVRTGRAHLDAYPALLDRLIALAQQRHAEKQQLKTSV
jgi:hypothetical protein